MITSVLSSSRYRGSVSALLDNDDETVAHLVNLMLEAAILTLKTFTSLEVVMPAKFKKNLLVQTEKVLERSLSLLPVSEFIKQCSVLLRSEETSVRHRALEVVSSKLASISSSDQCAGLVSPLVTLSLSETHPHSQQLALLAVRQLSKLCPDTEQLRHAADSFNTSFLQQLTNAKVLGAAVLSLGDILTSLGPAVVSQVPGVVTWLSQRLETKDYGGDQGWSEKEIVVVFNSFLYCLQKLVETFIGFISPLLPDLILMTCVLASDERSLARATPLLSSLASHIPPHTVLAAAPHLLSSTPASAITHLVQFVADNVRRLERKQLMSVSKQFVEFYTAALSFRVNNQTELGEEKVDQTEDAVISAFLSVALKLSLEDFSPVYLRLANSLIHAGDAQQVTLFNLTEKVAAKLKSLFSFGVDSCVEFVTSALRSGEPRSQNVVSACLKSLTTVLKFNKCDSLSMSQYEGLVSSLLTPDLTLENPHLVACLVQLATSTPEDSSWKHLHFQILLQVNTCHWLTQYNTHL